MKIIMINSSPRTNGNTSIALKTIKEVFDKENVDVKYYDIGNLDIVSCKACRFCKTKGYCVHNDIVNEVAKEFETADGIVCASPVYYANVNGNLLSFLQRLFYSTSFDKTMKVGSAIVCARRSGTTASFDEINRFFAISNMPIVTSTYWNNIYGNDIGEAKEDREGLNTMINLANNMLFLIKSIKLGKDKYGLPEKTEKIHTNFIR